MAVETATVQSLTKEITSNLMKMPGKLATGHFCWCAEHGVDLGGESPLRAQSSENR